MAKTDFRYSDQDFFRSIAPDYGKYDSRVHLKNFIVDSGDRWKMFSVGTNFSQVYFDGEEGTEETKTSGSITLIAEGTNTTITSAGHGLSNTETVDITGTAGYDATGLTVSSVTPDTFDIATAYGSDEATGTWTLTETATVTRVGSAKEWYYNSGEDVLYIYVATASDDPNDDEVIEIGEDRETFVNQALSNASQELNSLIHSHVTPIPKTFLYNDAEGTETPEYDYILMRAECLIAYSHLASGGGDFELSDILYEKVTNPDGTGIVDRINDGTARLGYEKEASDSLGRIIRGTITGTMELTELSGVWSGDRFDRIKVECTTTGAYGVGKFKVYTSSTKQLYAHESSEYIVNGRFQTLAGGIYGRFEGNSMTDGDTWFFEVRNDVVTNASTDSVELWR